MSVSDIIDRIKSRMAAVDPNGPRKCTGIVQINLSDQSWTMDLEQLSMVEGSVDEANATFDMDDQTFVELGNRSLDIDSAMAEGRVKVVGDKEMLQALREVAKENNWSESLKKC